MRNKHTHRLAILTLIVLPNLSVYAAPAIIQPDAGQTLRELQKDPGVLVPKASPSLRIEGNGAAKGTDSNEVRIGVTAIHVTGNSVFTASELEALTSNLVGGEFSLAQLNAGATRITAYYREHGYVVARAYLPAQDIKDGVVVINVLEGIAGQKYIDNKSLLSNQRANAYLNGVRSGDVLQAKQADRALLLLNDTPGVGDARATLQPGASVGFSDLLIELTPAARFAGDVEVDNYGNSSTGQNRLGAALVFNSPLSIGDQLSVRVLATNQSMNYGRLAYQLPLGGSGLRVGVAYSDTSYRIGTGLAAPLLKHGTATDSSIYAVYPFIRSQDSNFSGTLTWEDKKLKDLSDAAANIAAELYSNKEVKLANLDLSGNHQDALVGGGVTYFDASLVSGTLTMDAATVPNFGALSKGSFIKLAYSLTRLQRVTDSNLFSAALSAQQTNKNLNSSEQFSLGGAYGVRAYPQGEGTGDQGWMTNLELRHSFKDNLQGVLFYDAGTVTIVHTPIAAGINKRFLSGAGLGVNAGIMGVQLKAYAAWRTSGGLPTSIPAYDAKTPILWVEATKAF